VDARRRIGSTDDFEVTTHGGRTATGRDAIAWISEACELGVGEILLNSMDADGTQQGYDLNMLRQARTVSTVPLIASGGAGSLGDFVPAAEAGADALLAASVFHFGKFSIREVKRTLAGAGFEMRLSNGGE